MKFQFLPHARPPQVEVDHWLDWKWQLRKSLRTVHDFAAYFDLSEEERAAFSGLGKGFKIQTTPYYASLAARAPSDSLRRILMPSLKELQAGAQSMEDPLAENKNQGSRRLIHRYSDRVLFLVTDICSVYCRYCTRKHFTGQDQAFVGFSSDYENALEYLRQRPGIREVILSGGDPLTLSDEILRRVLSDLRSIDHIEIIRIGSRMPVVNPMRMTDQLASTLSEFHPVFLMTHFNHPDEITDLAAESLLRFVNRGIPVMNQMVLLNGVNNHPALVQALSRRLLYLRVKPYYMFQCDPSFGTDHLRTSLEDSQNIQRELWGHLSGLAMPSLSVDIPEGGGKASLVPEFRTHREDRTTYFTGWDGVQSSYVDPEDLKKPTQLGDYEKEWELLKNAKTAILPNSRDIQRNNFYDGISRANFVDPAHGSVLDVVPDGESLSSVDLKAEF